jgi:hypothetical protein
MAPPLPSNEPKAVYIYFDLPPEPWFIVYFHLDEDLLEELNRDIETGDCTYVDYGGFYEVIY